MEDQQWTLADEPSLENTTKHYIALFSERMRLCRPGRGAMQFYRVKEPSYDTMTYYVLCSAASFTYAGFEICAIITQITLYSNKALPSTDFLSTREVGHGKEGWPYIAQFLPSFPRIAALRHPNGYAFRLDSSALVWSDRFLVCSSYAPI